MKKLYLMAMIMLTTTAQSADWTPAFRYLEHNKTGDNGKVLDSIMENVFRDGAGDEFHPNHHDIIRQPLTTSAKTGNYTHTALPYRQDMQPAHASVNVDGVYLQAVIPLDNATLYGRPLDSLTYYYGCTNCGDVGFFATFKPMTHQQYRQLVNSVRFKTEQEDDACFDIGTPLAGFYKEGNQVDLVLTMGC